MSKCLGCDSELDELGKYGFCSREECRLRVQGFEIAMRRIVADPWIQKAALREIGGNSMTKCDGCVQEIRKLLDSAKREPAHSPTEDALIDWEVPHYGCDYPQGACDCYEGEASPEPDR